MRGAMEQMIRRYGTAMVLVHDGQEQQIRAFLQETRSHSQENVRREISPLGEISRGMYVYIGPVTPEAAAGDLLLFRERIFELRRAESVMVGDHKAYCWGLCVEKGSDSQWGS